MAPLPKCPELPPPWWVWIDDLAPLVFYVAALAMYVKMARIRHAFPAWQWVWRWQALAVLALMIGRTLTVVQTMGVDATAIVVARNIIVIGAGIGFYLAAYRLWIILRRGGAT